MPKPFGDLTGSGAHFHMSLWDTDNETNLFLDESDPSGPVADGLPLHGAASLAHAKALVAVHRPAGQQLQAPHPRRPPLRRQLGPGVRDLRRLQPHPDDPHPGPRPHRETAASTAPANPYLASAVLLAAGLDGIENQTDPGRRKQRETSTS